MCLRLKIIRHVIAVFAFANKIRKYHNTAVGFTIPTGFLRQSHENLASLSKTSDQYMTYKVSIIVNFVLTPLCCRVSFKTNIRHYVPLREPEVSLPCCKTLPLIAALHFSKLTQSTLSHFASWTSILISSSSLPFNSTNISLNVFKKNVYTLLSCVLITSSILAPLIKTS